jgi:hypothetical protein
LRDHSSRPNERGRNANNILAKARKACTLNASEEIILLEVLNAAIRARRDYEDEHDDTKGKKRKRVIVLNLRLIDKRVMNNLKMRRKSMFRLV